MSHSIKNHRKEIEAQNEKIVARVRSGAVQGPIVLSRETNTEKPFAHHSMVNFFLG